VNIHLTPARSAASLETVGLAFLFAPIFHPALKHAAQARKAIGVRTFFNFVGPLCNPARASRQLIGISEPSRLRMMAEAARDLGVRRALVVHGSDGMDELTVFASSRVASLENGIVREGTIRPEDAGMRRHARRTFRAGGVRESARAALQLLEGRTGAARDLVILNAGATLHVGGLARSLREGVSMAMESLDTGRAAAKLEHLRAFSRADAAAGAGDGTGSGGVKR
jgi:anthranilate phosphoribosyltransferase